MVLTKENFNTSYAKLLHIAKKRLNMLNGLSRRAFLALMAISPFALKGCITPSPKYLARYSTHRVPEVAVEPDISAVVNGLISPAIEDTSHFVPASIDLVQRIHYELHEMTYGQHMRKNLANKNPIYVCVVKNLIESQQDNGVIEYDPRPGGINLVSIDGSLTPAEFVNTLAHELGHSAFGVDHFKVQANKHRLLAHANARYPELLIDDDKACILTSLFKGYYELPSEKLALLSMLPDYIGTQKSALDEMAKAASKSETLVPMLSLRISSKLQSHGFAYYGHVLRNLGLLADETFKYMLRVNPDMPLGKKQLLRQKLDKFG